MFHAGARQADQLGLLVGLFGRADEVEIGGEILGDDAGERGVRPFGRAVGHAIEPREHRHGEAIVMAVAADFIIVGILADRLLAAHDRARQEIVGKAGAGDQDRGVPAEAKGGTVMADAQRVGRARGDAHPFAGEHDDAGGGEYLQEAPLARRAPAIDPPLRIGRGDGVRQGRRDRRKCAGHGKALSGKEDALPEG